VPREVSLFGILLPTLLPALLVAAALYVLTDRVLARCGAYRWVWHVDLFRVALFAIEFSLLGCWIYRA